MPEAPPSLRTVGNRIKKICKMQVIQARADYQIQIWNISEDPIFL